MALSRKIIIFITKIYTTIGRPSGSLRGFCNFICYSGKNYRPTFSSVTPDKAGPCF